MVRCGVVCKCSCNTEDRDSLPSNTGTINQYISLPKGLQTVVGRIYTSSVLIYGSVTKCPARQPNDQGHSASYYHLADGSRQDSSNMTAIKQMIVANKMFERYLTIIQCSHIIVHTLKKQQSSLTSQKRFFCPVRLAVRTLTFQGGGHRFESGTEYHIKTY